MPKIVFGKFPIETLNELDVFSRSPKEKPKRIIFNGLKLKTNSWRYQNILSNGETCVSCGSKAEYLKLEVYVSKRQYKLFLQDKFSIDNLPPAHFNIYGVIKGKETLFTKDHIWPASLGGRDCLENFQTMCCSCNFHKKNNQPFDIGEAIKRGLVKSRYCLGKE